MAFDIDGTLVDTYGLIFQTLNDALSPVWGRRWSDEEIAALFGPTEEELIRSQAGEERAREILPRFYALYRQNHAAVRPYPGIPEVVRRLREEGVALGVITNKGRTTAGITLEELGLGDAFQALRTGSEGKAKPDPAGLLSLLEKLGAEPGEAFIVGDTASDIRAGAGAGVRTVAALWGRPENRARLEPLAPDVLAERPEDVLEAVLGGA